MFVKKNFRKASDKISLNPRVFASFGGFLTASESKHDRCTFSDRKVFRTECSLISGSGKILHSLETKNVLRMQFLWCLYIILYERIKITVKIDEKSENIFDFCTLTYYTFLVILDQFDHLLIPFLDRDLQRFVITSRRVYSAITQ